jgi:pimeloyl-ACP methyl ester carboxylesterase
MPSLFCNKNNIEYTDNGSSNNVVVLLHGFGEDATIWNAQVSFLQNKYRVIVPNLPGIGKSLLLQNKNVTIEDYATSIYQLIDNILPKTNQKITLLGHSMGGYIALAFAKFFPLKLNGFGLIHSTAFADSNEKKLVRLRGIEMMKEYGSYAFLKNTIPNLFSSNYKNNHWQQVEALIENSKTFAVATLQQHYMAMMNRENTTSVLMNATVPVLFVMGTEDVAAPLSDTLQQCHLPQQSHIHILQNVGHMGMLEDTHKMNECIASFLQQIA